MLTFFGVFQSAPRRLPGLLRKRKNNAEPMFVNALTQTPLCVYTSGFFMMIGRWLSYFLPKTGRKMEANADKPYRAPLRTKKSTPCGMLSKIAQIGKSVLANWGARRFCALRKMEANADKPYRATPAHKKEHPLRDALENCANRQISAC